MDQLKTSEMEEVAKGCEMTFVQKPKGQFLKEAIRNATKDVISGNSDCHNYVMQVTLMKVLNLTLIKRTVLPQ